MKTATFIAIAIAIATTTPATASAADRDIILQGEQVVMKVLETPVSNQTDSPNLNDNKAKEEPKLPDASDVIERGFRGETLHREDWLALAQLPNASDVIKRGLNGETLHMKDWLSLTFMLLMGFVL